MRKVLLASTAVAAFVAFSGVAKAQDPGREDFGGTEGGGGAGSAFTVTTKGAVKFYLKYATGDDANAARINEDTFAGAGANAGLFTLVSAELEFNGAATTDSGIDIDTHVDLDFSGVPTDSAQEVTLGGSEGNISVGNIVRVQELSMKFSGAFGSVQLGTDDGAEDVLKITGAGVSAGTGGVDGDHHQVTGGVGGASAGGGGSAGKGDSGDALKATYLSPVVAGFQTGASVAYSTAGPGDVNGGTLGIGVGAKYSGSAGGVDYGVSVVWGDRGIAVDGGDPAVDGYGGLGVGGSVGVAGVSIATGVTVNDLGAEDGIIHLAWSGGVAYAIAGVANVSVTSDVGFDTGHVASDNDGVTNYVVFVSADYAVLPGVTLALDLGYGDSDVDTEATKSSGFSGVFRAKAAF